METIKIRLAQIIGTTIPNKRLEQILYALHTLNDTINNKLDSFLMHLIKEKYMVFGINVNDSNYVKHNNKTIEIFLTQLNQSEIENLIKELYRCITLSQDICLLLQFYPKEETTVNLNLFSLSFTFPKELQNKMISNSKFEPTYIFEYRKSIFEDSNAVSKLNIVNAVTVSVK